MVASAVPGVTDLVRHGETGLLGETAQELTALPGVGAGALLTFIVTVGYYITPALVGGSSGQLISNMIAMHMTDTLNWSMAAALAALLLGAWPGALVALACVAVASWLLRARA